MDILLEHLKAFVTLRGIEVRKKISAKIPEYRELHDQLSDINDLIFDFLRSDNTEITPEIKKHILDYIYKEMYAQAYAETFLYIQGGLDVIKLLSL